MKKILLIFFTFMILPVHANNSEQQKLEINFYNNYSNKFNEKQITALVNYMMIWQDYNLYVNDKENSLTMYGEIMSAKDKYCSSIQNKSKIKCKYLNEVIRQINYVGEHTTTGIAKDQIKYITIDNKDMPLVKLVDGLINTILTLNSLQYFPFIKN